MPDPAEIADARIRRVLFEFVRPAVRGPSCPLDELAALHVHGEPISYEDAIAGEFEPFRVGGPWGLAWDTTWFRLRGRVPEQWRGEEVALGFEIGNAGNTGFGAEALVWDRGRPSQGLSPNHRDYLLTRHAGGGDPVDLLIEAAANPPSPFGANPWPMLMPDPHGPPLFTLARADLHVRRPELTAFWHDFRVLFELLGELPSRDPRAARLRAGLERACNELDLTDIPSTFTRARPVLGELLDQPAAPRVHRVSAVGHAHLDTAWLWPLRETVRKCARTFSTAVRLMDDHPEYRFACSQAQHLAWMKERYPDLWVRIREKIASGQFEPTGSMWVEADCNIPSGESLVRQIVYGKRFYLDELGIETEDVWLPDVFGYSAALPQIMRRAGIRWFLTQKLSWNQYNVLPHHSFLWEGIDGSRVFTHFPPSDTYSGQMNARELRFGVENFKDHDRATRSLYPFGHGDGGGGPTEAMLESAARFADLDGLPRLAMEGPREFFVAAESDIVDPAVWVGELYLELHRGTYTSQAATKAGNRRAELALRDAELWSALAPGVEYPAGALERAWKTLLVHQFHDIIPGSGIHWVYEDTARDHAAVLEEADALTSKAVAALVDDVDTTAREHPVVLINSLSHDRDELVAVDAPRDATVATGVDGARTPLQRGPEGRALLRARVSACGWSTYDLGPGDAPVPDGELSVDANRLENARLRVTLDEGGQLASVFDKVAAREVLAPGTRGNLFQLHPDYPSFYDAWDVDRFYADQVTELDVAESIDVLERGPLRVALGVSRTFGDSRIVQVISLAAESPFVEFDTRVDWHETNRFLKVAFPLAVHAHRATYEIQYGHVERPTHANTSWDVARFEVCAHKWADLSEPGYGVALLNDSKYGYDVRGNVLRLSLLRAPTWPDPVADRGHHRFTYRLLPHDGDLRDSGVIDAGYDLNVPLRTRPTDPHPGARLPQGSLVRVDAPNVVLEVVKRADRDPNAYIVRLYEAWGRRGRVALTLPWPVSRAARTDLLERPTDLLERAQLELTGETVRLELAPFEIATLLLAP